MIISQLFLFLKIFSWNDIILFKDPISIIDLKVFTEFKIILARIKNQIKLLSELIKISILKYIEFIKIVVNDCKK